MATPNFRGSAVIYGAAGSLTFNATAITGMNQSGSATNADKTLELEGSTGKVETVINIENIVDVEFELIPSHATTVATAQGYAHMIRKNDKLVTSGFFDSGSDYNGTFRVMEFSTHIVKDNVLTLRVKARKNEADFSGASTSL